MALITSVPQPNIWDDICQGMGCDISAMTSARDLTVDLQDEQIDQICRA